MINFLKFSSNVLDLVIVEKRPRKTVSTLFYHPMQRLLWAKYNRDFMRNGDKNKQTETKKEQTLCYSQQKQ